MVNWIRRWDRGRRADTAARPTVSLPTAPPIDASLPAAWIVSDEPASTAALGFQEYAAALADTIRRGGPDRFTIGIYGPWGSGKSTLLGAIRQQLAHDDRVIIADFDAWRYAKVDQIVVPLLHAVHRAAREKGQALLEENLRRALEALVFSLSFKVGGTGLDATTVRSVWKESGLPALDAAFAAPFSALRDIPQSLNGHRVVVLIDDLDRCSPANVVGLLEAVSVVMDIEGFVFVLALDFEVLTDAIKLAFPHMQHPHEFVDKIVQIPFRVPPIDIDRPTFLQELVPDITDRATALPGTVSDRVLDMARHGLERNPRQLKRLINGFGLIRHVLELKEIQVPDELLLAVLGLQLRWPSDYREFQEAVLGREADALAVLRTNRTDPVVDRFRSRFLDSADSDALHAVVSLAAVVSSPAKNEPDPFVAAEAKAAAPNALRISGVGGNSRTDLWSGKGHEPTQPRRLREQIDARRCSPERAERIRGRARRSASIW
jgi:hypothetical protein